jgi:hypothetical protein
VAEVHFAGAKEAVEGVGFLEVDGVVIERLHDEEVVELECGAVFGEDEVERLVESVRIGRGGGALECDLDGLVVTAVEGGVEGGLLAGSSGGEDVAAKLVHGFSFRKMRWCPLVCWGYG